MNRSEFFKELGSSLGKTIKAFYEPVIQEKSEILLHAADEWMGLQWEYVMDLQTIGEGVEQRFICGQPVFLAFYEKDIRAFSGICPECTNLLVYISPDSTGKCLSCDKDYHFKSHKGSLRCSELPVKADGSRLYVSLNTLNKTGNGVDA